MICGKFQASVLQPAFLCPEAFDKSHVFHAVSFLEAAMQGSFTFPSVSVKCLQ